MKRGLFFLLFMVVFVFKGISQSTPADSTEMYAYIDSVLAEARGPIKRTDFFNLLTTFNSYMALQGVNGTGLISGGDTASMLTPYISRNDTAAAFAPFIERSDTASMLTPYIGRGDTADMLSGYARQKAFIDTAAALRADIGSGSSGGSMQFVATLTALAAASDTTSSVFLTDSLMGGLFLYYTQVPYQNIISADSGIAVSSSVGSGYWVRYYTGSLKPEWWGAKGDGVTEDHIAFRNMMGFINRNNPANSIIELRQSKTYVIGGRVSVNDADIEIRGNNATIKRAPTDSTSLEVLASNGQNYVEVVNPAIFSTGEQVVILKSGIDQTSYKHSAVMTISSINGDSLIFSSNLADNNPSSPAGDYAAGATVYKSYNLFEFNEVNQEQEHTAKITNLTFDGNKDNYFMPNSWTVDRTIDHDHLLIAENCEFYNMPGDNIIGNVSIIENCFFQNNNTSAVHYSYESTASKRNSQTSYFNNNVAWDNCQINNDHSEGVIVWSNAVGNVHIEGNVIDTSAYGILGSSDNSTVGNIVVKNNIFRNSATIHQLNYNTDERKEVRWEGNKIQNCGLLFYQYLTDSNSVYFLNNELHDSCKFNIARGGQIFVSGNLFRNNYSAVTVQEPRNAMISENVFYNTTLTVINTWGADIVANRFYNESASNPVCDNSSFIYITSYPSNYASQRINIQNNVIRENNDNSTTVFRGIFLNAYNFQSNIIGNEIYKVEHPFRILNLSSGGDSTRLIQVKDNLVWCVPRTSTSTGTNNWDADIILTSGSVWHNNWLWASKEVRDFLRPAGGITANNHFEFIGNSVWSENNGMDIIEGTDISDQDYWGLWINNTYNGNVLLGDTTIITDTKNYTISDRNLNLQITPNYIEPVDFVEWQ